MSRFADFLKRKDIEISFKRYGIDAMSAMAQGLFCTLLIGTILNTLGTQFHISFLTKALITVAGKGLHCRPNRLADGRTRYGCGHRLCLEGSRDGTLHSGARGLCHECAGRGRRSFRGVFGKHSGYGMWKTGEQGDEDRPACDPYRDPARGFGSGRRCGFGRLLRPDGGLRRDEFSGE